MYAKLALRSVIVAGAIALAAPAFAQGSKDGMDVAPGGGVYSKADVASEPADRMSHPAAGEARAPSQVAKGSLADVDQAEDEITSRLNQEQLNGTQQTAAVPNQ
jgi:hypothetical protein